MGKGGADADLPVDLFRFKIHQRGTIIHLSQACILPRIEEDGFNQRGLSLSTMAEGSDVPDVVRFKSFHLLSFLLSTESV